MKKLFLFLMAPGLASAIAIIPGSELGKQVAASTNYCANLSKEDCDSDRSANQCNWARSFNYIDEYTGKQKTWNARCVSTRAIPAD